jgi:uncharacterized membrane protein (UPF0127 family)
MTTKSKIIILSAIVGLSVAIIAVNYISSEIFSLKYWNPIHRVYFKNMYVKAEVVDTQAEIENGLAGRKELPIGRGMLFVMPSDGVQKFWMKGMQFGIDIIWMERGAVIGCDKNISPKDDRIFTSPSASQVVLEVPQGFCDQFDVRVNDQVGIQ